MLKTKSKINTEIYCFSPISNKILEEKILFSHDQITADVFFSFSLIYLVAYTLQSNKHSSNTVNVSIAL